MSQRSRKRKSDGEDQTAVEQPNGEQDNFFSDKIRDEMETMWEIPQIFHFLHLTRESLNIPQLSMYEMERMLLIPRASKQLANIMTCLLSSPITKAKLRKVPPMPYEFWTNILTHKMTSWFKVYHAKHKDATKVLETIGVEPEFWNIFPDASLLDGKDFENLSFKQRVWLLKTVCDTIMHTRKTVQEDMAKQPWEDQFETTLGLDRHGARYIYFPQFIANDLRIYRLCLDNKILSTVRPVKPKQETNMEMNSTLRAKLNRYRMRRAQSSSNNNNKNSSEQSSRHESRVEDKDLGSYKCNNDSATNSFISEDTNLSSASTCSNNNNISLDAINRKRCRSLSKMSEESTLSNARSSGYDTNTSDNRSLDDDDVKMFKGFSDIQDDNCKIGVINEMLDDLKTEIDEDGKTNGCENGTRSNSERTSQEDFVEGLCKKTTDSCNVEATLTVKKVKNERRSIDDLTGTSKTDDEKLNEIISAENSKLPAGVCSKRVSDSDNVGDNISTSSSSKSDDEKLSETKTSNGNISDSCNKENGVNKNISFNGSRCASFSNNASLSKQMVRRKSDEDISPSSLKAKLDESMKERSSRKKLLRSRHRVAQRDARDKNAEVKEERKKKQVELEDDADENFSASEIRLEETMGDDDSDDDGTSSENGYNLRRSSRLKTDECKEYFNKLLSDLSISDFQLVADGVESLRDFISSFTEDESKNTCRDVADIIPLCEIKLVKKLNELLSSVESTESVLKDATRKAKAKMQREWSNFKDGSVEDQDSSGEGGLSSNWWVLGSQGCPLSAPGDATLQTLPQLALSPLGTQSQQSRPETTSELESAGKSTEREHYESQERTAEDEQRNSKKAEVEGGRGRKQFEEKEQERKRKRKYKENEVATNDEETEQQQTRRVLRARGVSSYTEQFYSDDESDQNELEEWTDVEAVYAAPGASADTSASHAAPKARQSDDWSETEDSDQDWILPGTRKRKNKRPSANRRLKSLQNKLQNIRENCQNNVVPSVPNNPAGAKIIGKDNKPKDNSKSPIDSSRVSNSRERCCVDQQASPTDPKQAASPTNAVCKIEPTDSVHSELDIKDEGPIYDTATAAGSQYSENNYRSSNPQQNYMMKTNSKPVSYYVMPPQNMPPTMPMIRQSYYMQGQPNYLMQNPRPNFLPAAQQQQPPPQQTVIYQQQAMMNQPYVNNVGYAPYSTQSQYNMVAAKPPMTNQPQLRPASSAPRMQGRPGGQQNRYAPRQNLPPQPNVTIARNNAPVRDNGLRSGNAKFARGKTQQQRAPNLNVTPRRVQAQQTPAESTGQKTTSLIVLSDSDDEIEMIITEKTTTRTSNSVKDKGAPISTADRNKVQAPARVANSVKQKPMITSDTLIPSAKGLIPPQILERMNQGGISITPVKNIVPQVTPNANTQLVVVVNETGSHYALALPNGSKLILTPEQVAQIRASNGGKLIL